MDGLISDKLVKLDLINIEDCKKAVNLSELSIKSKYKIFDKINAIFKSSIDNKITNGNISQPEVDVFSITLGKRNLEKEAFLKYKDDYFKIIRDRINITYTTKSIDKPYSSKVESIDKPSSSKVENIVKASSVDHTAFADEPAPQEIIDVILSIFDSIS